MQTSAMWYVIWTLSKNESELLEKIKRKVPNGLYERAWIPMRKELRKFRDRESGERMEREVAVKLFPGYVFIDTDAPDKIHGKLRREKEYIKFLKTNDQYAPLNQEEEKLIRRISGEDGVTGISTGIIRKKALHIVSGPLKGLEPYIVKIDRHKKKAYLEMLLFDEVRRFPMGLEIIEKDAE